MSVKETEQGVGRLQTWLNSIPRKRYHQLVGAIIILIIWELMNFFGGIFFPSASETIIAFVDLWFSCRIFEPLSVSMQQFAYGLFLAILLAFPLGTLMGASKYVSYSFDPFVNVMFVTSVSSLLPFLIIVFGTGVQFRTAVVFLFAAFHMSLEIQTGVKDIDKNLIETAKLFGSNKIQLYRYTMFPAALPYYIAALRIGTGRALIGMVAAELWIFSGIGELMLQFQRAHRDDYAMAIAISIMLIAMILVRGLYRFQRWYAPWQLDALEEH
jgi:ABC-type nitrate/sulfonate/bicarbonate transport system permease component